MCVGIRIAFCTGNVCTAHQLSRFASSLQQYFFVYCQLLSIETRGSRVCADALEHAAWTQGSRHLQPLRDDLSWFQHSSYDVLLFLTGIVLTILTALGVLLTYLSTKFTRILRRLWSSKHQKTT